MGVHWCGWCGGMSGGGFCDECAKEAQKIEKEVREELSKKGNEKLDRLLQAVWETY